MHGIFNGFRSFKFSFIIFVFVCFVTFYPVFPWTFSVETDESLKLALFTEGPQVRKTVKIRIKMFSFFNNFLFFVPSFSGKY